MSSSDELRRMVDEREIRGLAVEYCWALDERDWDRLGEVFLSDATANLSVSGLLNGLDAIISVCRRGLSRLDSSHHMVTNHQIVVEGDEARHRCYVHAQHLRRDAEGGASYIIGGRYEDRLVRTPRGWRIKHRNLIVTWSEGNPGVVRPKSRPVRQRAEY